MVRPKTSDFSTFRQIFMDHEYDFKLLDVPNIIVDAGANIGLASLFFAQRFPSAKIFALEPDHSNFEMLMKNTNRHPK